MQTLTLTLAANAVASFDISGAYFEIIDSVGLVSVNFYDASGSRTKDLELQRVLSGFFVKGRYSRFEITESSGSAQTITVLYGSTEGGTRRSPGIVTVTNKIGASITQLELSGGALTATGFSTVLLVAPAANPRGVLIRRAVTGVTAGAGGNAELRIVAAPVVPASSVPTNAFQLAGGGAPPNVNTTDTHVDQNYQLPANWGIWGTVYNNAVPAATYMAMTYELL